MMTPSMLEIYSPRRLSFIDLIHADKLCLEALHFVSSLLFDKGCVLLIYAATTEVHTPPAKCAHIYYLILLKGHNRR